MRSIRRIILDLIIILAIISTIGYIYQNYGERIVLALWGESTYTIYIEDLAVTVSVADEPDERRLGLSGTPRLEPQEGKLFIFDTSDYYGIWMKDMLIPLDIIWLDESLRIVHIEENVLPSTYPASFNPPTPARFVLEVNAFFADTFNVSVGDRVVIPKIILPDDLK